MSVDHVEVLVEEPSMEAALRVLLPDLLGSVTFEIYPFRCKDELMQSLAARLAAYARWLPATHRVLVLVDRDDDECHELKSLLEAASAAAGLATRTARLLGRWIVANRIVIEELEAWFLGDVPALRVAFPRVPESLGQQARFRDPDAVAGGTWEALERVLQRAGYFKGGLRKIEAARAIAPHLDPDRNRSRSFQVFRDVIREIAAA
jgi:hypothetical protein